MSVPAVLAALAVPCGLLPASAQDISAGRQKAQVCSTCHGLDGIARVPDAPNLAGDNAIYLAAQLNAYKSGQRSHPQMSIIAQGLSEADIADLAAWYAAIEITATVPAAP